MNYNTSQFIAMLVWSCGMCSIQLITTFHVILSLNVDLEVWTKSHDFLECFLYFCCRLYPVIPSVLWRCWLGGRKGIRPVKKLEWWGTGMVICLERDADMHMAQLMPLPLTVSCFSKIQIGFTFLVPGSPGKRAIKRVCVCVCVFISSSMPELQLTFYEIKS